MLEGLLGFEESVHFLKTIGQRAGMHRCAFFTGQEAELGLRFCKRALTSKGVKKDRLRS